MNTEELHIFATVYKCRSFSQAADKLYMSPQGVSKVIVRLENEMGVQLFNRTTQGITPTLYADRLYSQAQDIHLIFEKIKSIENISSLHKETLNIFSTYGFLQGIGLDFFLAFQNQYPNIVLNAVEFPDSALMDKFLSHQANIGFATGPYDTEFFDGTYIATNRFYAVIPLSHELSRKEAVSFRDLKDVPIAIKGKEYQIFRYNIANYTREGLYPNIALETSENTWIVEFALSRRGIGIILDDQVKLPIFQKYVEGKQIVFREIVDPEFKRDVYFLEVRNSRLTAAEKAFKSYFLDYLSAYKKQLYPLSKQFMQLSV